VKQNAVLASSLTATSACSKVDGEIDPEGHSKYYSPGAVDTDSNNEAAETEY
jgi:hypothetical protein